MRNLAFVAGVAIVALAAASVFSSLVMPRAISSRMLRSITRVLGTAVRALLRLEDLRAVERRYEHRDRVMAVVGPLGTMLLFVAWLGALVVGFALMCYWASDASLAHALAIAGSSVFTLGIAVGLRGQTTALEIVGAAMGFLVVALEIAYLPTLYSAFSRRETEVTLLGSRAGTPAWGPEILVRAHWFRTMDELTDLYRTWERWSAEVAESHTNYPTLMFFRSPVRGRSWLTALTAMLDACALHDAVSPGAAPRQARLCLQMGMNCLRAMAETLGVEYDRDPKPTSDIRLTFDEFRLGWDRLESVGFPIERDLVDAWRNFAGWRVNYEAIVDAITLAILPPPAPWFLPRPELGEVPMPRVLDRTPDDPDARNNPE